MRLSVYCASLRSFMCPFPIAASHCRRSCTWDLLLSLFARASDRLPPAIITLVNCRRRKPSGDTTHSTICKQELQTHTTSNLGFVVHATLSGPSRTLSMEQVWPWRPATRLCYCLLTSITLTTRFGMRATWEATNYLCPFGVGGLDWCIPMGSTGYSSRGQLLRLKSWPWECP